MKHLIPIFLLLCFCIENIQAQHFTIKKDTIWIPAADYATPTSTFTPMQSAKCRDYYFCFYKQDEVNTFNPTSQYHLLAVSLDGKTVRKTPVPQDATGIFAPDIFCRDGELYVKPYWDEGYHSCRFDFEQWKWEKVSHIPDWIYEDADYKVFYKDFRTGEEYCTLSDYVWFRNKHSGIQHVHFACGKRIVAIDHDYFSLRKEGIYRLENPNCGTLFGGSLRNEDRVKLKILGKHNISPSFEAYFMLPSKYTWGTFTREVVYDTLISNMWVVNNQLYFWTTANNNTFVSTLANGKLCKITDIGEVGTPLIYADVFRGTNQGDNQFLMRFQQDDQSFGLIDVVDTNITIHYFVHHLDTLCPIGYDNIISLMDLLWKQLDNLNITTVDQIEKRLNGTPSSIVKPVWYGPGTDAQMKEEDKDLRKQYFRWIDEKQIVASSYDFNRNDSLVVGFKIRLQVPNRYAASRRVYGGLTDFAPDLYEQLKAMFTERIGVEPSMKEKRCQWTFRGHTLILYEHSIEWRKE